MKKRFVVCVDSSTASQNEAFKAFIQRNSFGWWHWLSNVWLLVDSKGISSARDIRDELANIFPGVHNLVLELREGDDTWSGFGTKTPDKDMFKWLKKNW